METRCRVAPVWAALLSLAIAVPAVAQEAKITSALSAAPASVSADATILDWPAEEGGEFPVLREGSNGWTCLPDNPKTEGTDSMCLDAQWMNWVEAWTNKTKPMVTSMGFGYMLRGDSPMSNTDPYALEPSPDNEWMPKGVPHLMVLVPDPALLEGMTTDHTNGGPWVMWKGTPYVHVMVPMPENRPDGM